MKVNYSTERLVQVWLQTYEEELQKDSDFKDDSPFLAAERNLSAGDPAYDPLEVDEATAMFLITQKIKERRGGYERMMLDLIYKKRYGPADN